MHVDGKLGSAYHLDKHNVLVSRRLLLQRCGDVTWFGRVEPDDKHNPLRACVCVAMIATARVCVNMHRYLMCRPPQLPITHAVNST